MRALPLFDAPGFSLRELGIAELGAVQGLFGRCEDYFLTMTGNPPTPSAALELLIGTVSDELNAERRRCFGVFRDGHELVAVAGCLLDVPRQHELTLSLLLVEPALRSRGLGERLYRAVARWAGQEDVQRFWVMTGEHNRRAVAFWQRLGFRTALRHTAALMGPRIYTSLVLGHAPATPQAPLSADQAYWQRVFTSGTLFARPAALPRTAGVSPLGPRRSQPLAAGARLG